MKASMEKVKSVSLENEKTGTRANVLGTANAKVYVDGDNVVFDVCLNQTNISGNNNKVSRHENHLTCVC